MSETELKPVDLERLMLKKIPALSIKECLNVAREAEAMNKTSDKCVAEFLSSVVYYLTALKKHIDITAIKNL